jgi:hypothetical protein
MKLVTLPAASQGWVPAHHPERIIRNHTYSLHSKCTNFSSIVHHKNNFGMLEIVRNNWIKPPTSADIILTNF